MKFLIIKISAIGDVVMALGMSTYIREKYPEATITWVCGEIVAPLLRATNAADQLITVNEQRIFKGNIIVKITELLKIWRKIFFRKFDMSCVGYADFRYRFLALPAIAKTKRNFRHYPNPFPIPGRYHANEYLRLVTGNSNIAAKLPKLTLELPASLLALLPQNSQPIVALVPGGAKNILRENIIKRWPIENYVKLAQQLLTQGYNVILTGGISDLELSQQFSHLNIIDFIGKTTLLDVIALCQHCLAIVTHDTGTLHLAKLTNTHIIALFGPTMPFEFGKIDASDLGIHFLWNGHTLPCCPCYDGKNYANCNNNLCMQKIAVNEVLELISMIN